MAKWWQLWCLGGACSITACQRLNRLTYARGLELPSSSSAEVVAATATEAALNIKK